MFDKKKCDLRSELPKEIDEDLLMEIYTKITLVEAGGSPKFDDKNDPENFLRLSAGAWTLALWLEGCCGKEVREDGAWVVSLYGEDSDDKREHEDHPDYPKNSMYPGHWLLKEGRSPHWLDYRIPYEPEFDDHALIDLHWHLLGQAQKSKAYDPKDVKKLDKWAAEQAKEGSTD